MSERRSVSVCLARSLAALVLLASIAPRLLAQSPPSAHHAGQWTTATTWPGSGPTDSVHAVHMALMRGDTLFARPHSQVLAWGNWTPNSTDGGLWAWNPTTDVASQALSNLTPRWIAPPPYNLFCAGHTAVPDASGDLLVVGGTERGHTGENLSARFRREDRTWLTASMSSRRWYPNGTSMHDPATGGTRILATAGNSYDHMVLFGGRRQSDGVQLSDVRRYAITDAGHWDPALTDPTPGVGGPAWPDPRESHTLADQVKGPYFLFGGKSGTATRRDVWQLVPHDNDFEETYRWEELAPSNSSQELNRWRHAAVTATLNTQNPIQAISTMYVHGGETITETDTVTLGDLWKLEWRTDLQPNQWRWLNLTASVVGVPVTARSGHSAVWDRPNQRLILYGGQNADGSITDANVYVLRFPGGVPTWSVAAPRNPATAPLPRSRHAMASDLTAGTATGIVFGGVKTGGALTNELWEFWVTGGSGPDTVTWFLRPPGGTAPAPRAGATAILYELFPRSYVVVGGELAGGGVDATVWEFRRDTNSWSQHPALGQALTGHMAFREHRVLTPLQAEAYDPATNTWAAFGQTKKRQSYHMIFPASDGRLYSPGPNASLRDSTWVFDPGSGAWSLYSTNATEPLDDTVGGILYRPDQMMKCGGLTAYAIQGNTSSLPTGLATPPLAAWRPSVNKMAFSRHDHILSMLPTGQVLATGGQGQGDNNNSDPDDDLPRKRPEIWDPTHSDQAQPGKLGWWYGVVGNDTLAAEPVTRAHHSSAVLLPDGRLLSGGGWDNHPSSVRRTVDQYSPPYLFKPAPAGGSAFRPRLYGAQDHIPYSSETFKVACPDPVLEACLIRPGATTHAFNQDNRYVPLTVQSQDGHRVTLRYAGLNANHVPPGNYLLFVLRDDNGRKVPSIARWVNVGSALPIYATWDTLPPATIGDLTVSDVQGTSQTVSWTAPADLGDGTSGKATRYELRYREGGQLTTLDDFFANGRRVDPALLPMPATAGASQSYTVTGLSPDSTYFFRILSRDGAGSDRNWSGLSNSAQTPGGGSSGCPFVDTRTAAGWQVENSILGRSLTGALALDGYRLKHAPEVRDGRVRLRVRENEQERTTLDQLRLVAVDHAPGVRGYALGEDIVLGTRVAAARVTTSEGVDLTALFSGTGAGFAGGPGDTLLIEFGSGEHAVLGEEQGTQEHDPFHIDDGGKCPPDCGSPLRSADPMSAMAVDAQVLGNSGLLLQASDGRGGWRTVHRRYPREHADEAVLEGLGHGPVRLVFVGRHTVRFLGRLQAATGAFTVTKLPLLAARHSRLGDVAAAMDTTGSRTSELAPGDTVSLEFAWTPVPEGQVRELLLLSHGVYTANLPASLAEAPPERFAIQTPRPNPFAGSTLLRFDLPLGRHVRLEVLDPQGRRVRTLANHALPAGSHAIEWDGRNEAGGRTGPGVYFYRFEAGEFRAKGRVTRVP